MGMRRKMMKIKYIYWFFILCMPVVTSCSKKSEKKAHLQFVSMISGHTASVKISPLHSPAEGVKKTVPYATPSGYIQLNPGKYRIRYAVGQKPVLDHTFVLGPDSYQTLLAAGLYNDSLSVNPTTTAYTMKRIVAGAEVKAPNGFYPQFLMLRDRYQGSTQYALVRLIHSAPYKKKLLVKNRGSSLASGLKYPAHTEPAPKKKSLHLNIIMGAISLKKMKLPVKKGYLHTIIIGDNPRGSSPVTIRSYKTATTSLLKKH